MRIRNILGILAITTLLASFNIAQDVKFSLIKERGRHVAGEGTALLALPCQFADVAFGHVGPEFHGVDRIALGGASQRHAAPDGR